MVLFCSFAVDIVLRQRAQSEVGDGSIPFFLRTIVAIVSYVVCLFKKCAYDMFSQERIHPYSSTTNSFLNLPCPIYQTTPFLWLRIMAFVKIRNKQLATFILCSVEIIRILNGSYWFSLQLWQVLLRCGCRLLSTNINQRVNTTWKGILRLTP